MKTICKTNNAPTDTPEEEAYLKEICDLFEVKATTVKEVVEYLLDYHGAGEYGEYVALYVHGPCVGCPAVKDGVAERVTPLFDGYTVMALVIGLTKLTPHEEDLPGGVLLKSDGFFIEAGVQWVNDYDDEYYVRAISVAEMAKEHGF